MIDKNQSAKLKLELLSQGIDFENEPKGLGVSLKEEYRALFDARLEGNKDLSLPPEIVLPSDIVAKTIYRQNSPYLVRGPSTDAVIIKKSTKKVVSPIKFPPRPEFYNEKTESGTPMKQIAQLLGLDCLGIIVNSYCSRVKNNKNCKFCNINSNNQCLTDKIRSFEDIFETSKRAHLNREFGLVNLTGGTFMDPELEFLTYMKIAYGIRTIMGSERLPGVSSINPPSNKTLSKYKERLSMANFDLLTYNLEVWDNNLLKEVCPGKYDLGGREFYIRSAKETMSILGEGHVGIILTVGPWEDVDRIIEGSNSIASEGILPIPVVFHPGKGAEYSWMGTTSVENLLRLYSSIGNIYKKFGLIKDSRPRAAGSEKSFRNSLINEAVLGYLT